MAGAGPNLRGIIATCLTPFDEDVRVDYEALHREIDYILDVCHADAIAIAATEDAEYAMLDWDDRVELMRRGTEMVAGRVPVILGISHPSTHRAIELAEYAKACGADVAQVLMPTRLWGGDPEADEICDYVSEIAIHSPLPLSIYHKRGPGADPGIPVYLRLADLYNVPYILETSGDVTKISRLAEEIDRRGSAQYFTTIESLLINLTMGGSGAAMPPPATFVGAQVVRAFREGNLARAIEWQRILGLFPNRWYRHGAPPVMKAAMRHLGIPLGDPAPPYGALTERESSAIGQFLEEVGLKERGEDAPAPQSGRLGPPGLQTTLLRDPQPGPAGPRRAPRRRRGQATG